MGVLTLAEFRSEVRFDLKNRPDTGTSGLSDTRLNRYINHTYLQVCHPTVHRHRELTYNFTLTLVSGTNTYTFSPVGGVNITSIHSVSHVDATVYSATASKTRLFPRDSQWFEERTITSNSIPNVYSITGNSLEIEPVPGSGQSNELLYVRAYREPELLSADGDTTVIGTLWDEVVLLGARWRAELHLGYRDLAEATKLDFAALINEYDAFDRLHGYDEFEWSTEFRTGDSPMESAS